MQWQSVEEAQAKDRVERAAELQDRRDCLNEPPNVPAEAFLHRWLQYQEVLE